MGGLGGGTGRRDGKKEQGGRRGLISTEERGRNDDATTHPPQRRTPPFSFFFFANRKIYPTKNNPKPEGGGAKNKRRLGVTPCLHDVRSVPSLPVDARAIRGTHLTDGGLAFYLPARALYLSCTLSPSHIRQYHRFWQFLELLLSWTRQPVTCHLSPQSVQEIGVQVAGRASPVGSAFIAAASC